MDETMKTRSIFEIAKGTFDDPATPVNKRVSSDDLKFPFSKLFQFIEAHCHRVLKACEASNIDSLL